MAEEPRGYFSGDDFNYLQGLKGQGYSDKAIAKARKKALKKARNRFMVVPFTPVDNPDVIPWEEWWSAVRAEEMEEDIIARNEELRRLKHARGLLDEEDSYEDDWR